jgi:Delta7-sterol 5-desaturase
MTFAVEYGVTFLELLLVIYLLPAALFHWLFFVRPGAASEARRIQQRRPSAAQIRREVRSSLIALLLFALGGAAMWHAFTHGATAIYLDVAAYPWWWAPAGFVIVMVAHDAYFYATHRLMHLRPLFQLCHAEHHRSITPTPWSILAFTPLETLIQFALFGFLLWLVPLHPATLLVYMLFNGMINAAGHCGHEIIPPRWREHRFLKYLNAVTHHDLHHSRFRYNFAQYFNIWDRLFGTFLERRAAPAGRPPSS